MPVKGCCDRFNDDIAKNGQENGKLKARVGNFRVWRAKNPLSAAWPNNLLAEPTKAIGLRENPKGPVICWMSPNQLYGLSSMDISGIRGNSRFAFQACQYITKSSGGEQKKVVRPTKLPHK